MRGEFALAHLSDAEFAKEAQRVYDEECIWTLEEAGVHIPEACARIERLVRELEEERDLRKQVQEAQMEAVRHGW